jgi:hypothetical protein
MQDFNEIMCVTSKVFLSSEVIYVFEAVAGLTRCEIKTFEAYVVSSNSCFVLQNRLG